MTDHTTWEYNSDDMVQSVTDARGITTTFGYNARHSLASITYPVAQNLPLGIPSTANVSYGYDAAGNRTSMADASGNIVNYNYDSLSRLTSEARQFAGLSGTYTLAYEYTLAGQVKTVTDQSPGAGTSFSYALDNVGRLSSVTSTGLGATAPLASNAEYRASGALKHREYGNGTGMNIAYNNRGMISQYSLTGVKETNGAARAEGSDFQYYADGQVKFASDFYGRVSSSSSMSIHDKSYERDQLGRLRVALSGVEANDFLNNTYSGPFHGAAPYLQTSSYDAWDNLVSRNGWYWTEADDIAQTYDAHNRNFAWTYDADGRLISMNEPPFNEHPFVPAMHTYDAAGRHVKHTQTVSRETPFPNNPVNATVTTIDAVYDGDGQQVKRVETTQINSQPPGSGPGYYLRSSVLGGQVITEIDAQGGRFKSHVYGGGALIASTSSAGLVWRFNNPVTGDGRETDAQGKLVGASYVDPDGMDVGATDPASGPSDPGPPPMPMAGAYGSLFPGGGGLGGTSCIVDGIEMGCGLAGVMMDIGAAGQCPDNNCNPRMTSYGLRPLYLTDDGFGFWVRSQLRTAPTLKGPGQARPPQGSGPGPTDDGTNEGRRPSQVTLSGVNFMDPQKSSVEVYDGCSKLAPEISLGVYLYIRDTLKDENVDPTLLAVTWANEGSFSTRPENNQNSQRAGDVDIGPVQINYRQWANWSGFHGLPLGVGGVFGNSLFGRQEFNGSVLINLRAGARILNEELRASNGNRADAAGYYTSGRGQYVQTPPGQRDFRHRRDSFNRLQRAFDKFFECVGLR